MRKYILIAFLFAFTSAFSQNNDSTKYYKSVDYGWQYKRVKLDSILMLPNGVIINRAYKFFSSADTAAMLTAYLRKQDTITMLVPYLRKSDTGAMLLPYAKTSIINAQIASKVNITDTASMLSPYYLKSNPTNYITVAAIVGKVNYTDTALMLSPYAKVSNLPSLAPYTKYSDTAAMLSSYYNKTATDSKLALDVKYTDTALMLSKYYNKTATDAKVILKVNISDTASMLTPYAKTSNLPSLLPYVKYTDTSNIVAPYLRKSDTTTLSNRINTKINISDTAAMLNPYYLKNNPSGYINSTAIANKVNYSDTSTIVAPYLRKNDTATLSNRINAKLNIADTTTMLSGYYRSTNPGGYITSAAIVNKVNYSDTASMLSPYAKSINVPTLSSVVKYTDTATMLSPYYNKTATNALLALEVNYTDTASMLSKYYNKTATDSKLALDVKYTDTALMLTPYAKISNIPTTTNLVKYTDTAAIVAPYLRSLNAAGTYYLQTNPSGYITSSAITGKVNISDTATMLSPYARTINVPSTTTFVKYSDTATMLSPYYNKTAIDSKVALEMNYTDTALMLSKYARDFNTVHKTGAETIAGIKTFSNGVNSLDDISTWNGAATMSANDLVFYNSNAITRMKASSATTQLGMMIGGVDYFRIFTGGNIAMQSGGTFADNGYKLQVTGKSKITDSLYANTITKIGGTSSQFLKADGSIDATTYVTAATVAGKVNVSDTATMLSPYLRTLNAGDTYIPYTGATKAVNLGAYDMTVNGVKVGLGLGSITSNSVLGKSALNANTTGNNAVAVGSYSLLANTTGYEITAVGGSSLVTNSTGIQNTATGYASLYFNTTGGQNSAFGKSALQSNTTGTYNTGLGYGAGSFITTGNYNTIIGGYVGTAAMSSNIVLSDGNGNIRYQWDGTNTTLGQSGNVGIGAAPGAYKLDVTGVARVSSTILSNGGIVSQVGASGTIGAGSNFALNNTGTGINARSLIMQLNASYGMDLWKFDGTSYSNIGTHFDANGSASIASNLYVNGTTSNSNYSFFAKRATDRNMGIGLQGTDLSIEFVNDAITANVPTRIYANPLTIWGGNVGINTLTPNKVNVNRTLSVNATSSAAGFELNVADGNTPFYQTFDGTNVSIINMANGFMRFGNNNAQNVKISSSGEVLLGTDANVNNTRLQVAGSTGTNWVSATFSGTGGTTDKVVIGNLGTYGATIGGHNSTLTAWANLSLNPGGGAVYAGSARIDNNSDARIKDNIHPIINALDKVLAMKGKTYHMIDEDSTKIRYGFIAQELQGITDELVIKSNRKFIKPNGEIIENLLGLETWGSSWAALLVEAIKEQQIDIKIKQTKIDELENRLKLIEQKLNIQ